MKIRHACHDDLDTIMSVYQHAKKVMEQSGNPGQWVNGYPSRELIEGDLRKEHLFVLEKLPKCLTMSLRGGICLLYWG